MSQPPPPPPGTPPQDGAGSGEPQDPRAGGPSLDKQQNDAGGYGYPQQGQQPPQPGGYGYPQAPGQQPGQQPGQAPGGPAQPPQGGFGAPPPGPPAPGPYGQPQPGPYGQPPYGQGPYGQPYGQPEPGPYGHPGMAPTMPPGGRPPGSGGNKMLVIIAAVVAVLLVAGGGIWFLAQDDGDTTNDPQGSSQGTTGGGGDGGTTGGGGGGTPTGVDGELLFTMDAPKVSDSTSVEGAWATEKYFVKGSVGKILGVDAQSGDAAWKIALDGQICAASPHQTEDDKTAVVTRESSSEDADCNQMVVIDLRKGEKVWQQKIPGDADVDSLGGGLTMSQGTIAAVWIGGSAGYRVSGGDPLWVGESGDCRDEGFAGGEKLVAVVRCGGFSDAQYRVQTLDPKTGKAVGEFKVPAGVQSVAVASTSPLVIGVGAGEYGTTDIMSITDDHKLDAKITLGERYHDPCRSETESCWTMAASEDLIFLSTKDHDASGGESGRTNAVMAFDIHSGATKWKVDAGTNRAIMPIGVDGERLVAYRTATYDEGGEIVGIDPATQKETLLLKLPSGNDLDYEQELGPRAYSAYTEVVYEHNRLFFHEHLISERAGSFTDERLLAVAYGPA